MARQMFRAPIKKIPVCLPPFLRCFLGVGMHLCGLCYVAVLISKTPPTQHILLTCICDIHILLERIRDSYKLLLSILEEDAEIFVLSSLNPHFLWS
jgi:hypothetical protein